MHSSLKSLQPAEEPMISKKTGTHNIQVNWSCAGEPMIIKKAVCMHEEDYGTLWKHTEYRTGHSEVRRSRRLVLSFIATIANYEYGFYWYFYQVCCNYKLDTLGLCLRRHALQCSLCAAALAVVWNFVSALQLTAETGFNAC